MISIGREGTEGERLLKQGPFFAVLTKSGNFEQALSVDNPVANITYDSHYSRAPFMDCNWDGND